MGSSEFARQFFDHKIQRGSGFLQQMLEARIGRLAATCQLTGSELPVR